MQFRGAVCGGGAALHLVWGGSTIAQLGVAGCHTTSHDRVVS